ncbi:MAG: hypothetical protein JEZ06_03660 [Anaerolineaceae bacterium]|nr:hypothetical protein [Anaerolineaceae bacterium]
MMKIKVLSKEAFEKFAFLSALVAAIGGTLVVSAVVLPTSILSESIFNKPMVFFIYLGILVSALYLLMPITTFFMSGIKIKLSQKSLKNHPITFAFLFSMIILLLISFLPLNLLK